MDRRSEGKESKEGQEKGTIDSASGNTVFWRVAKGT